MAEFGTVEYYENLLRDNGKSDVTLQLAHQLAKFAVVENASGNHQQENAWFNNLELAYEKITEPLKVIVEEGIIEPSNGVTLRQKCNEIYEKSKSGMFSIPAYYKPDVPDDIADQRDEWYTIGQPDSLWILNLADIPKGDFSHMDVLQKVLVFMKKKSTDEYYKEQGFHLINGYSELEDDQKELFVATFDRHMKCRGTDKQIEFATVNLKEIKWDAEESCLKVYYKSGDWWHYDLKQEWY